MKITIIGDGSFGSFLKELLASSFTVCNDANTIILAVPLSAYDVVASQYQGKHLVNVCSVQKPSMDICWKYSNRVTGIHPLFGRRTPADKRNTILTNSWTTLDDTWFSEDMLEDEFLSNISKVSNIVVNDFNGKKFTPESHDILMAKTHVAAVTGAQQLKVLVDRSKDIPDNMLPNSFRLMKDFVKTLDDMPKGTIDSILSNPYI